ncbi:MAG: hypothetical protein Q8R04_06150 [Nanoarchaeota archaeon]|nr:hypothetical protein [Nanoarchaeota archaeon]
MVETSIRVSDPNNPNSGYDVYIDGKLVGWARTSRAAQEIINRHTGKKMTNGQKSGGPQTPSGTKTTNIPTTIVNYVNIGNKSFLRTISISVIILILVGIGLWWFNYLNILIQYMAIIGFAVLVLFIFISLIYGSTKGDQTIILVSIVLLIWLIDRSPFGIPFFGRLYAGFNFDAFGTLKTDWFAISTSVVIVAGLSASVFYDISKNHKTWIISLMIIIFIFRVWNWAQKSPFFETDLAKGTLGFAMLALLLGLSLYLGRGWQQAESYWSFLFMIILLSYFYINFKWTRYPDGTLNLKAIAHMAYILYFGIFYIRPNEELEGSNPASWHLLLPAMLILDFFFYDIVSDNTIFGLFPILPFFVLAYSSTRTKSAYAKTVLALVIALMIVVLSWNTLAYGNLGNVQFSLRESIGTQKAFGNVFERIKDYSEGRLELATGGLYKSQVEKNQFEPLGVFFDRVRAAQPRFYSDEPVTLWATIKSRTLSDPILASFTCYRWEIGQQSQRKGVEKEDTVFPPTPFVVYTLEEKDVECTFTPTPDPKKSKLQAGTNTLTLTVNYTFATSAYKKAYFMDKDRFRAMIKENLDPLKEFGITDKTPNTIYTNGPVELDIGVQNIMPVSDDIGVLPSLSILLKNRNKITDKSGKAVGQWEGKIKKINELVVVLPKGITIFNPELCRPVSFTKIKDLEIKNYCDTSCINMCERLCEEFTAIDPKKPACSDKCKDPSKSETRRNCDEECDSLFKSDTRQSNYEGYKLDVDKIIKRDDFKDIERDKEFVCRIKPTQDVLENQPITTKFIRVKARYEYSIDKSFTVIVDQPPTLQLGQSIEESIKNAVAKIESASGLKIPIATLKGLVYLESNFRHCCAKSGENKANNCKYTDELTCDDDKIITSGNGKSIGIMQINRDPSKSKIVARNKEITESVCEKGQDIHNRDCNIKVGVEILRRNYQDYAKGADAKDKNILKTYCPEGQTDHDKYAAYRQFDAVLRAYHGWGCKVKDFIEPECRNICAVSKDPACVERCIDLTINYVERVKQYGTEIEGGIKKVQSVPEFEQVPKTQGSTSEAEEGI